jgi:hypothetical protein
MVLKVPNCINIGYDAMSLSYDSKKRAITALYHGVQDWDRLLSFLQKKVYHCLHPLFIPTALFSCHRYHLSHYRDVIDEKICGTEHQIGYAVPGRLEESELDPSNKGYEPQELNYESIVRRLHSYQTELATIANVARFGQDCGDFLMQTLQELETYSPFSDDEKFYSSGEEILHEVELSRSLVRTLLSQNQALKERVQSQTNLVSNADLSRRLRENLS